MVAAKAQIHIYSHTPGGALARSHGINPRAAGADCNPHPLSEASREPLLPGAPQAQTPPTQAAFASHRPTARATPRHPLPAFQTAEAAPVFLDDLSFGEGPEKDLF